MIETRIQIDGMRCGMCEAHVDEAVRRTLPAGKVRSSHTRGETVVLTREPPDERALREAIEATGYRVLCVTSVPREKRGLAGLFK